MTADVIPLDPIASIFGTTGLLARAFPGYAPREGQIAMARLCNEVLTAGGSCMVDAPCGTGKSVAYLAPAILRAVKQSKRVIVATANIALQEQLTQKDLSALREVFEPLLGADWTFALLKGRSNYVCKHLVENPHERAELEGALKPADLSQLAEVDRWAARTDTGDRTELPFVVSDQVWRMRSMDRDDCHGKACEFYESCFARKAHDRAAEASVVVVNYHLLFAHIAMRAETGREVILPEHDALVMDEAHEAADIARDFFGHTLSEGRVARIVRWARAARGECLRAGVECSAEEAVELAQVADTIESASITFFRALDDAMAPLLPKRIHALRSDQPSCASALMKLDVLGQVLSGARVLSARIYARVKRMVDIGTATREALRVQRDAERVGRACVKALSWIGDATRDPGTEREPGAIDAIHWIAAEERDDRYGQKRVRLTWESRHIDLAPVMRAHAWDHTRTVIACSATMTTGIGPVGWQWIKRQLGAPPVTRTLSVASPFDFERQALLCLPAEMPDPKTERESFDQAVCEIVGEVARAAGGRTLGLFTSTRMAREAADYLRGAPRGHFPFAVLAQGDKPRTQLVSDFKADETSVLCGTSSLWTGVDVPGHALVCVVVDKLPFAPPGDPVMDALCERAVARAGGRSIAGFMEESLPRAVLALRQGVGRLIRSTGDWGCVVICDPRLTTKAYGAEAVRALGMPRRTRSIDESCAWLRDGVEAMGRKHAAGAAR